MPSPAIVNTAYVLTGGCRRVQANAVPNSGAPQGVANTVVRTPLAKAPAGPFLLLQLIGRALTQPQSPEWESPRPRENEPHREHDGRQGDVKSLVGEPPPAHAQGHRERGQDQENRQQPQRVPDIQLQGLHAVVSSLLDEREDLQSDHGSTQGIMFKINPPRNPNPRATISEILPSGFSTIDADRAAGGADGGVGGGKRHCRRGGWRRRRCRGWCRRRKRRWGAPMTMEAERMTMGAGSGRTTAAGQTTTSAGRMTIQAVKLKIEADSVPVGGPTPVEVAVAGVTVGPISPRFAVNGRSVGGRQYLSLQAWA